MLDKTEYNVKKQLHDIEMADSSDEYANKLKERNIKNIGGTPLFFEE